MKKFHITITNNETGESVFDTDSDAIIGAVCNDTGATAIAFTNCGTKTYAQTIAAVQMVVNGLLKEDKKLNPLVRKMRFYLQCQNRRDDNG